MAVEGSIQTRSYDAKDGSKRYVTEIIADSVEAVGSPREGVSGHSDATAAMPVDDGNADFIEVTEQIDLPF